MGRGRQGPSLLRILPCFIAAALLSRPTSAGYIYSRLTSVPGVPKCGILPVHYVYSNATLNRLLSSWSSNVTGPCNARINLQPAVYQLDKEYIFNGRLTLTIAGPRSLTGGMPRLVTLLKADGATRLFTAASGACLTLEYITFTTPGIGAVRRQLLPSLIQDILSTITTGLGPTASGGGSVWQVPPITNAGGGTTNTGSSVSYSDGHMGSGGGGGSGKASTQAAIGVDPLVSSSSTRSEGHMPSGGGGGSGKTSTQSVQASATSSSCSPFSSRLQLYGGAILAYGCASATTTLIINNCKFEGFKSWLGGAVCSGPYTSLKLQSSVFRLNTAQSLPNQLDRWGFGGAVAALGSAEIRGCTFVSNGAFNEAGALGWCPASNTANSTVSSDTFLLQDTLISSNIAGTYGGGLSLTDGTFPYGDVICKYARPRASVTAVQVANNAALLNQVLGGGVYLGQNTDINCSLIANNTADALSTSTASWGGGIYVSGYYRPLPEETTVTLTNVFFGGNAAKFGVDGWVDSYSTLSSFSVPSTSSTQISTQGGIIAPPVRLPCSRRQLDSSEEPEEGEESWPSPGNSTSAGDDDGPLLQRSRHLLSLTNNGGGTNFQLCSKLCRPARIAVAPVVGLPPASVT